MFILQYPVLSLGEGLGSRVVLHEGSMDNGDKYLVEECEGDDNSRIRRLIFLQSPGLSQTEVRIISGKGLFWSLYMYFTLKSQNGLLVFQSKH